MCIRDRRKGHYVVYIKEGAHIVDSLNIMEAYVSLMKLENVRILKEMRNSVTVSYTHLYTAPDDTSNN